MSAMAGPYPLHFLFSLIFLKKEITQKDLRFFTCLLVHRKFMSFFMKIVVLRYDSGIFTHYSPVTMNAAAPTGAPAAD